MANISADVSPMPGEPRSPRPVSTTTSPAANRPALAAATPSSRECTTLAGPRNDSGASSATVRLSTAPSGASDPRITTIAGCVASGADSGRITPSVHRARPAIGLAERDPGHGARRQVEQRRELPQQPERPAGGLELGDLRVRRSA